MDASKNELEITRAVLSVLLSLYEMEQDQKGSPTLIPLSPIYMAFGMDMQKYRAVIGTMENCGWAKTTSSTIALTEAGREKGRLIAARLEQAKHPGSLSKALDGAAGAIREQRPKRDVWFLWLATDGEVKVAEYVPAGGSDNWLPFTGKGTPFNEVEARTVASLVCKGERDGVMTYMCDPRTQGDLRAQFSRAVEQATSKVRK